MTTPHYYYYYYYYYDYYYYLLTYMDEADVGHIGVLELQCFISHTRRTIELLLQPGGEGGGEGVSTSGKKMLQRSCTWEEEEEEEEWVAVGISAGGCDKIKDKFKPSSSK